MTVMWSRLSFKIGRNLLGLLSVGEVKAVYCKMELRTCNCFRMGLCQAQTSRLT